ncbi:MAG: ATPase [Chloroflexales bacterium]|nr:ATPase [Chloroflexales bacterium]
MRILLIAGQGTSLQTAAALSTACHAAQTGLRVLIVGIGPSHRLGALIGRSLGSHPLELEPNLAAMETASIDEIGQHWDAFRPGLRGGLAGRLREIGSDDLPSFPGMDEFSALLIANRAISSKRFDLAVFDGPAIDNLLRVLALPDTIRWVVRLIFGLDRGSGRSRSSQEMALIPAAIIAPNSVAPLQEMRILLEEQRAKIDVTSGSRVRLVFDAEDIILPSLRNVLSGLGLYGLKVDTILVRGEESAIDAETRKQFGTEITDMRPPLLVDELAQSPTSLSGWAERGAALYGKRDQGLAWPPEQTPATNQAELRLSIPFLDGRNLDIAVINEEVVVRMGQFRRHVLLPGLVSGGKLRARVDCDTLRLWVE